MDNKQETTPLSGCLFRLFWILVGPALLLLLALLIAANQVGLGSVFDIIYGVILVLIVGARFIDKPTTPNVSVVTPEMEKTYRAEQRAVKLYVTIFPVAAIALWLLAHFVLKRLF